MDEENKLALFSAAEDFHRARQRAFLQELMARVTGERVTLLSYDEVRQALKAQSSADRGIQEVPLQAIAGSVNRYDDFTRDFLPRAAVSRDRWAHVEAAASQMAGWPPIEVYKIGEIYFVKDGNHRVSAARQIRAQTISAYVTEVETRVPIGLDLRPEDLILKAEYTEFLEHTHLDELRPEADLSVSEPGQYPILEEHIAVHRYFMGLDQQRDISYEESVTHWYDAIYTPVVEAIRQAGILRDFPGRSEADLYLWLAEHRSALETDLGMHISPQDAASDLASSQSPQFARVATRLGSRLADAILPDSFSSGPKPGQWRQSKELARKPGRLFSDILVPVNRRPEGFRALEMAILVARQESGDDADRTRLHGLHVVESEADKDTPAALALQAEFEQRCKQAGLPGNLVLADGDVTRKIVERARRNDLVVVNLAFPPSHQPLAALTSGFRSLLQHCPRPLLAIPQSNELIHPAGKALLAYDGSPKAKEALYVAAYIAAAWHVTLAVISVLERGRVSQETIASARQYLESHQVQAQYLDSEGPVEEGILRTAEEGEFDLLLMGGYGRSPVWNVVISSEVDRVLRESHKPMLICR